MDNFEEWWKVNGANYDYVLPASRDAFEAGQESRQAEVDQLQSQINEIAEVGLGQEIEINNKDEHARNLYYENANLQLLIEEKDKRIEAALVIVTKMAKATNSTAMWAYDLDKALRGEHEY